MASRARLQPNNNFFQQGRDSAASAEAKVKRAFQRCAENGVLNLSEQSLSGDLPPSVCGFQEASWSENWWEQCPVTKIDVSHNELERIPPDIGRLSDCTSFNAFSNRLAAVPSELLTELPLKQLNLRQNLLRSLPGPSFEGAESLVELILSENQLTELPAQVLRLPSLEILEVSGNRLASLQERGWQCTRLRRLDISNNQIGPSLPLSIRGCGSLRELCASGNALEDVGDLFVLHEGHGWCSSMILLDLSKNKIGPTLALSGLTALDSLNVANNRLTKLAMEAGPEGSRPSFPRLSAVVAESNHIADFPPALLPHSAPLLSTLDLLNNNLSALPPQLGLNQNLKRLALVGNPLRTIRPELLRGSAEALKKHLRSRIEDLEKTEAAEVEKDRLEIDLRTAAAMKELCLEDRSLTVLPELPRGLQVLKVSGNALTSESLLTALGLATGTACNGAEQLRILSARQNRLGEDSSAQELLPVLLWGLRSLQDLDLCSSALASAGSICAWARLQSRNTQPKLQRAILSGNALEIFPVELVSLCPTLHELRLNGNRIESLENLAGCGQPCSVGLCTLDLEGNRLRAVPPWLPAALPELRCLLLANNDIGPTLPPEMGFWESLQAVSLVGNPLRSIRQALVSKDWPTLAAWLRDKLPEGAPRVAEAPQPPSQTPVPSRSACRGRVPHSLPSGAAATPVAASSGGRVASRSGTASARDRAMTPASCAGSRPPSAPSSPVQTPGAGAGSFAGALPQQVGVLEARIASLRAGVGELEGEMSEPGVSRSRQSAVNHSLRMKRAELGKAERELRRLAEAAASSAG